MWPLPKGPPWPSGLIAYAGLALFFTTVRTILRQEWSSVPGLMLAYATSMVCAVGTGLFLSEQKHAAMTCFTGVALAALVSHDAIKVVLNFGAQAAADKGYGGKLIGALLPGKPPAPAKGEPEQDEPKD